MISIHKIDEKLILFFKRYGHMLHRFSIAILFIWFGLLKPFGLETTTSLIAHTIYFGDPETMVKILGWWEVSIGLTLMVRKLVRVAFALIVIRLPFILVAFFLMHDVCFVHFPFALTLEGQYLIKDLTLFAATIAIAGMLDKPSSSEVRH